MLFTEDNPRPIKVEFLSQGRVLRQLKRQDKIAFYKIFGGGGEMLLGYEVVRIRINPEENIGLHRKFAHRLRSLAHREKFHGGRLMLFSLRREPIVGTYQRTLESACFLASLPFSK